MKRCAWYASVAIAAGGVALSGSGAQAQSIPVTFATLWSALQAPYQVSPIANAPVLRRIIAINLHNVPFAAALREISRQADQRLVYDETVSSINKRVTLEARSISVNDALQEVLRGTGVVVQVPMSGESVLLKQEKTAVAPVQGGTLMGRVTDVKTKEPVSGASVVIGDVNLGTMTKEDGRYRITDVPVGTHTVNVRRLGYTPISSTVTLSEGSASTVDFVLGKSPLVLDQVVVTGSLHEVERKEIPTPITVLTGEDLQKFGITRLNQIFRGLVTGTFAYEEQEFGHSGGKQSILVRGISTFGIEGNPPTIKTYVDGVEVADATYLLNIDPGSIDHIEVIRGPQASTLYGAEAISGVMQVFTKHGRFGQVKTNILARVGSGLMAGQYRLNSATQQEGALNVDGSSNLMGYSASASYGRQGEWTPGYGQRDRGVAAGVRLTQGKFAPSISYRTRTRDVDEPIGGYFATNWERLVSALPFFVTFSKPTYQTRTESQETAGGTLNYNPTTWWSHELTIGRDRLENSLQSHWPRFTTPADSLLEQDTYLTIRKVSARYRTTIKLALAPHVSSALSAGVDGFSSRLQSYDARNLGPTPNQGANLPAVGILAQDIKFENKGLFAQEELGLADALFLTLGYRLDDNRNFGGNYGLAHSPRAGLSYVASLGDVRIKSRVSYGSSIRTPDPFVKYGQVGLPRPFGYTYLPNPDIGPEKQRGYDAGMEFYFGSHSSIAVTHYDQKVVDAVLCPLLSPVTDTYMIYQCLNYGQLHNTGWEFEGTLTLGHFSLNGNWTATTSKVARVTQGTAGDPLPGFRVGDQISGVPDWVGGATAGYAMRKTRVSVLATLRGPAIGYDQEAYYNQYAGPLADLKPYSAFYGTLPNVLKFNLNIEQDLSRRVGMYLRVENLANSYKENQNLLDTRGRLTMLGVKFTNQ